MAKDPIRIAQVVGKVMLAGVDTMVMNYYRHIDRNKIQFDFIMDGYSKTPIDDEIKSMGGKVYKVEPYEKNILKSMHQCYEIFKTNHYSIVHSHMNTLSVFPLFEAWRAGVPVRIAHSHSTAAKGEGFRTIMKYMLRPFATLFSTHYCACSEYAGRWLFGDKLFDNGKVHLVKNAIDLDRFSFKPEVRQKVRKELNIDGKFVVGHVGRFVYQKNHNFLIDIFCEVHRKRPNSVLLLIGEGPLQEQIRQKVSELGLTGSVRFLGLRKDVPDLYQAMDVFVLPSFYEGLGMVAVEAQAAGLPVMVSDRVPEEAQVTDTLSVVRLSEPAAVWARAVLTRAGQTRRAAVPEIARAGYEIASAAKGLGSWYRALANGLRTGVR